MRDVRKSMKKLFQASIFIKRNNFNSKDLQFHFTKSTFIDLLFLLNSRLMASDRANIGRKNSRERTPIPSGSHTFNYLNFTFIASYNKCRKQRRTIANEGEIRRFSGFNECQNAGLRKLICYLVEIFV